MAEKKEKLVIAENQNFEYDCAEEEKNAYYDIKAELTQEIEEMFALITQNKKALKSTKIEKELSEKIVNSKDPEFEKYKKHKKGYLNTLESKGYIKKLEDNIENLEKHLSRANEVYDTYFSEKIADNKVSINKDAILFSKIKKMLE